MQDQGTRTRGRTLQRAAGLLVVTLVLMAFAVASPTGRSASADTGVDVYTSPGNHTVNGRRWRTTCEKYTDSIYRCRAEIWATKIHRQAGGGYESVNGWVFNNLTYLPSARTTWTGNPLASTGTFTSAGRQWRTSCNDAWTGRNACRSFILSTEIESYIASSGNRQYRTVSKWVFNNVVQFGTTLTPPDVTRPLDCTVSVEGVNVNLAADMRTATVARTAGTRATVTMVERTPGTACGTRTVFRDTTGRIGYGGTAPAAVRRQDTGTTPAGVFTVKDAFGISENPGTTLSWRDVAPQSYWVLDNKSAYYNQWREAGQGGFSTSASEHLISYRGPYDYAAVIDYNRAPAVRGKGGAIFLHVHGGGATAGCVSITAANMVAYLQAVEAGDTITIQ